MGCRRTHRPLRGGRRQPPPWLRPRPPPRGFSTGRPSPVNRAAGICALHHPLTCSDDREGKNVGRPTCHKHSACATWQPAKAAEEYSRSASAMQPRRPGPPRGISTRSGVPSQHEPSSDCAGMCPAAAATATALAAARSGPIRDCLLLPGCFARSSSCAGSSRRAASPIWKLDFARSSRDSRCMADSAGRSSCTRGGS